MERPLTQHIARDGRYRGLQEYGKTGGYRSLTRLADGLSPQDIQRLVTESPARGGGAGFQRQQVELSRWERRAEARHIAANADEMSWAPSRIACSWRATHMAWWRE